MSGNQPAVARLARQPARPARQAPPRPASSARFHYKVYNPINLAMLPVLDTNPHRLGFTQAGCPAGRLSERAASSAMGPLSGIRVVEVATWGMVPMAGTVLAEWGADVVEIEHPER